MGKGPYDSALSLHFRGRGPNNCGRELSKSPSSPTSSTFGDVSPACLVDAVGYSIVPPLSLIMLLFNTLSCHKASHGEFPPRDKANKCKLDKGQAPIPLE